jgi:hypothetical protein
MSDDRWLEVERDVISATRHFAGAVRLAADPALRDDDWDGYKTRMSLMHAMQAGHTSLETALLRIFDMRAEQRPSGDSRHMDLIRRAAAATASRPAILPPATAKAADQTRRFRHVAVRTYDQFEPDEATGAIKAAERLAGSLSADLARFRELTDQP